MPFPDEILYSWVCRLAVMNKIPFNVFAEECMDGYKNYCITRLNYDIRKEFVPLAQNLEVQGDLAEFYLNHSTIEFESLFLSPSEQLCYINNIFREPDELNTPKKLSFSKLKICPDCMKEDSQIFGFPYYHRSHQLNGVCTCYKHNTELLMFSGEREEECKFNLKDFSKINTENASVESLIAFTQYANELFVTDFSSDIYRIRTCVLNRISEMGYQEHNYNALIDAIRQWKYFDLIERRGNAISVPINISKLTVHFSDLEHSVLLKIIMFLFPNPEDFISAVRTDYPLVVKCFCETCGKEYYAHPSARQLGWGCPNCDKELSLNERYNRLLSKIENGEYEPLDDYKSSNDSLRHLHKRCGKEFSVAPRAILFYGRRCRCTYRVPYEEVKSAVESHPGFTLISYSDTSSAMEIMHAECGKTFKVDYDVFFDNPVCRACMPEIRKKKKIATFVEKVKAVTGDEYDVVSYDGVDKTAVFLHNACGRSFECWPSSFLLREQRCPECQWDKPYTVLCQFVKDTGRQTPRSDELFMGYKLGRWCCVQRYLFHKGQISQEHLVKLVSLGFDLEPMKRSWNKSFDIYKNFLEEPHRQETPLDLVIDGFPVGFWVFAQREYNKAGLLPEERKEALLQINPQFFDR